MEEEHIHLAINDEEMLSIQFQIFSIQQILFVILDCVSSRI